MGAGLIIAGATLGVAGGILANDQRRGEARRQRKYLKAQQKILKAQRANNKSLVRLESQGQAIQNTASSRANAVAAFQNESAAEATLGVSGFSGGTPFYNLASKVAQDRTALAEGNELGRISMDTMVAGAKDRSLQFDSAQLQIKHGLKEVDRQLDYLDSPLAAVTTALTGGLSGATMGADLSAIGEKYFGPKQNPVADGGVALDFGSMGSDKAPTVLQLNQQDRRDVLSADPSSRSSILSLLAYGG